MKSLYPILIAFLLSFLSLFVGCEKKVSTPQLKQVGIAISPSQYPNIYLKGDTINFINTGWQTGVQYAWTFGDGSIVKTSASSIFHVFNADGNFGVYLEVEGSTTNMAYTRLTVAIYPRYTTSLAGTNLLRHHHQCYVEPGHKLYSDTTLADTSINIVRQNDFTIVIGFDTLNYSACTDSSLIFGINDDFSTKLEYNFVSGQLDYRHFRYFDYLTAHRQFFYWDRFYKP